jgi:hypothetical protein
MIGGTIVGEHVIGGTIVGEHVIGGTIVGEHVIGGSNDLDARQVHGVELMKRPTP